MNQTTIKKFEMFWSGKVSSNPKIPSKPSRLNRGQKTEILSQLDMDKEWVEMQWNLMPISAKKKIMDFVNIQPDDYPTEDFKQDDFFEVKETYKPGSKGDLEQKLNQGTA